MDLSIISAAYTSVKALKGMVSTFADLKVDSATLVKIHDALREADELQDQLAVVRDRVHELQNERDTLKRDLDLANNWTSRAAQYEITPMQGGAVVYMSTNTDPPHFACPACFEKQLVMFLQKHGSVSHCPACKASYRMQPTPQATSGPSRGGGWMGY